MEVVSGVRSKVGGTGKSVEDCSTEGMRKVQGELWKERNDTPLKKGDVVKVLSMDGLHLHIIKT